MACRHLATIYNNWSSYYRAQCKNTIPKATA